MPDGGETAGAEQVLTGAGGSDPAPDSRHARRGGPATATRLAADLPVSRQAVTKHLVMLDRAGLVSVQRRGREMRYRIQPQPLAETRGVAGRAGGEVGAAADRRHARRGGRRARPSRDDRPG